MENIISNQTVGSRSVWSEVKDTQSCLTFCDPMDSIVHEILQARILEWAVFPFSRGSSNSGIEPRSPTLQADSLPAEIFQSCKWSSTYGSGLSRSNLDQSYLCWKLRCAEGNWIQMWVTMPRKEGEIFIGLTRPWGFYSPSVPFIRLSTSLSFIKFN